MTMFATIRKYNGVPQMSDELLKRQEDIKSVLNPIRGFHAYYLVKSNDGVVSMTLCEDKAGVEESNRVAATWLKDNLPTFATRTPEIWTGEVRFHVEPQLAKVAL